MIRRTLRAAQVDCGFWASIKDFLNPSIPTSTYVADAYQCAQYGSIPSPGTVAPNAPQTADAMTSTSWSPTQSLNTGQDYATATNLAIDAATDSGSYNPAGNLPVTADWLDSYKWPLLIGAAAIAGIVAWEASRQ